MEEDPTSLFLHQPLRLKHRSTTTGSASSTWANSATGGSPWWSNPTGSDRLGRSKVENCGLAARLLVLWDTPTSSSNNRPWMEKREGLVGWRTTRTYRERTILNLASNDCLCREPYTQPPSSSMSLGSFVMGSDVISAVIHLVGQPPWTPYPTTVVTVNLTANHHLHHYCCRIPHPITLSTQQPCETIFWFGFRGDLPWCVMESGKVRGGRGSYSEIARTREDA